MRYELRKVQALYADGGAQHAARALLGLLGSRLYRDEDHVVIVKDLDDGRPERIGSNLEVRAVDSRDTDTVDEFCGTHFPPKVGRYVRSYRRRGYPAFAAFRRGLLIGLFWWVDAAIDAQHPDLILHQIDLQPGDTYAFAYFIAPEHRGSNTATEVIGAVFSALRDAGYTRVWGWVNAANRPARWLFRLAGFQETRRVRVRAVLLLLALTERRVLIRNLGWRSRHAFGYRVLLA
jgi:RimJ/RimL family protein N-acetyltransferase